MNWGHRLKELITRNWREKIISLLLAFLFWFMIKAQDVRYTQPYMAPPPPVRITPSNSSPAPSQLAPVLPPPAEAPPELEPVVTPPPAVPGLSGAAGL